MFAWLAFQPASAAAATKQKHKRSSSVPHASTTPIRRVSSKAKASATAVEKQAEAQPAAAATPSAVRGPNRIEFGERLIQGQTNKSGAVYLYDRKELKTPSMIKKRESFREEILATIYGN